MRFIPFSRDVFLRLFEIYNAAIWPAQIVAYALCAIALLLALRPARRSSEGGGRIIALLLALAWLWNGVAYHMLHFATINWAAWLFGFFFVIEGLLLLAAGLRRAPLAFRFTGDAAGWTGLALIAYATILYPLIGLLDGEPLLRLALVGVAPCPTTLFTFGMLLLAENRTPVHLLVLPALWSLIAGAAGWLLHIPQDLALPVAALIAVLMLFRRNQVSRA